MSTRPQHRMIFRQLDRLHVDDDRDERLHITSGVLGHQINSFNHLTLDDAQTLIDTLSRCRTKAELWALLDTVEHLPLADDHDQNSEDG